MNMLSREKDQRLQQRYIIESIPLFSGLSAEEVDNIDRLIKRKQVAAKTIILSEDDTNRFMYIIFSGKVKVIQIDDDGRERILAIRKKGDYFGEMSLIDGKTIPATVIALENAEVGLLGSEEFNNLLTDNKVLKQIITLLCSRLRDAMLMQRLMAFTNAEKRVFEMLKYMGRLYGVKNHKGTIITLKLTHKDIANFSSLSRETVTRILNRLEEEKRIEIMDNKNIFIYNNTIVNGDRR